MVRRRGVACDSALCAECLFASVGVRLGRCAATRGTCRELLAWEASLWTFAFIEGVEPTNNHAERVLRGAVLWRKGSFGCTSEGGRRFVGAHFLTGGADAAFAGPVLC